MRTAALIALLALTAVGIATGQRAAAVGEPVGLVRYTALGDSVTWQNGYVAGYADHIETDLNTTAATTNLGEPGWLSGALLTALRDDATFRESVAAADAVTVFIGLNDYQWMRAQYLDAGSVWCPPPKLDCMQNMVSRFDANWQAIIAEIDSLNPGAGTAVRAVTIYNPYVSQDVAAGNFAYFNSFLDEMNAIILASAANGVPVADIHAVFNGPNGDQDAAALGFFTPPDYLHPNATGHQRMADELRALGYAELDGDGDRVLDVERDTDGDGCADVEELSTDVTAGGQRDPSNGWDFYDVDGSQNVDAIDINMVRVNFNPGGPVPAEDAALDRSGGDAAWAPGPPDNRINAIDIGLVRASFHHSCAAPS